MTENTLSFRAAYVGVAISLALSLAGCAAPPKPVAITAPAVVQPEANSGYTPKPGWVTSKFAVAAANPLATEAGYRILKRGGSAIDAAVAVQMVLGLVEPQSSGVGGGAFLVYFNGRDVDAFDGRETAPAAANGNLFLGNDGKPMSFFDAVVGGRSTGVPGAVRMLELAHKQYGKLPWASLFDPAIALSESGFAISPRLNTLLASEPYLKNDAEARAYFYKADGSPKDVGTILRNPQYAAVLRKIASQGSAGLLEGDVARDIVRKVNGHPTNPGSLSVDDLKNYKALKRAPFCSDYTVAPREYRICGMPPPSSGSITIAQILGILQNTPASSSALPSDGVPGADWLHLYTEASRLAFADRNLYIADPDFVKPPAGSWQTMVEPSYLASRAKLIGNDSMKIAQPGAPGGVKTSLASMPDAVEHGTSHISIVDGFGDAIAMTTTIESQFGSRQMVDGFLLNNELTDFSFAPSDSQGAPIANRVEPGKRPRSSMSPTLIFDKKTGELLMSAGSPGGALIIHFTAKTIYGVLNWGLTPQKAIDLPNFASMNGPTILEEKRFPASTVKALKDRGHDVREQDMNSGLQAITRSAVDGKQVLLGGADPRREGIVMGD